MKQQMLENVRKNALACLGSARDAYQRGDEKHGWDYLNRAIELLESVEG